MLLRADAFKKGVKQRFNEFIEAKGNIRVFVRIRPLQVENSSLCNFTIYSKADQSALIRLAGN